MSVELFKLNEHGEVESFLVKAKQLHRNLEAGTGVLDPAELDKLVKVAPSKEEADTNGTGKLSYKEIRAAAEKAGIKNFKNAKIADLKKKLGY